MSQIMDYYADEFVTLDEEERKKVLMEMVNEIIQSTKGQELENLDSLDIRLLVDCLASALGILLSHQNGIHKEPWNYVATNVFPAYQLIKRYKEK